MNGLSVRKMLVFALLISLAVPAFPEFSGSRNMDSSTGAELIMKSIGKKKKARKKKPGSAKQTEKKQAAKDKKLDKDYEKYVSKSRKRAQEIQTTVVRERMKQNVKDANANYKAKKKSEATRTKRGAKKYGR
jgi:Tfp pilus assembly protein FimT